MVSIHIRFPCLRDTKIPIADKYSLWHSPSTWHKRVHMYRTNGYFSVTSLGLNKHPKAVNREFKLLVVNNVFKGMFVWSARGNCVLPCQCQCTKHLAGLLKSSLRFLWLYPVLTLHWMWQRHVVYAHTLQFLAIGPISTISIPASSGWSYLVVLERLVQRKPGLNMGTRYLCWCRCE
jgi:hypothetical protein